MSAASEWHTLVTVPANCIYGTDVASVRMDELDLRALEHLLQMLEDVSQARPVCVDLGCGHGVQGLRFALLGAAAHLYDRAPPSPLVTAVARDPSLELSYTCADVDQLTGDEIPSRIELAYSQRFLHYLPYGRARMLVRQIGMRMGPDAEFFVSASGLESELADGYSDCDVPVTRRLGPLGGAMAEKHGIRVPVCLYRARELEALMTSCGFERQAMWTSAFGNLKGVFRKRR